MAWKGSNKFFAHKVEYKGIKFDSTHERDRYIHLCELQRQGVISGLRLQQEFVLLQPTYKYVPKQLKTKVRFDRRVVEQDARYTCDFIYEECGQMVMEEFKSEQTCKLPDYILRRKLMIKKIYEHNKKPNRKPWVFREVIYYFKKKGKQKEMTIHDK